MSSQASTRSQDASTVRLALPSPQPHLLPRQGACGGTPGVDGQCTAWCGQRYQHARTTCPPPLPAGVTEAEISDVVAEAVMRALWTCIEE
jgi:hypothetical protein